MTTDKFGICLYSTVPGRAADSDKSEMVTQLLFGETYHVLDDVSKKNWILVKISHDQYECWIDRGLHTKIEGTDFERWQSNAKAVTYRLITHIENKRTGIVFPILRGSTIWESPNHQFEIAGEAFSYEQDELPNRTTQLPQSLIDFATTYMNAPYLWGGRSPFGLDCSGFTQIVYKHSNIALPRDAYQQAELGTVVPFVSEARTGDLAFFENADGRIVHVGIVMDEGFIIHASSKVRIGKLDHEGIFDPELEKYTHKLRLVKRIL